MTKLVKAKHLAWKSLGDETVIIDSRNGKSIHKLNDVGNFLWNQIEITPLEKDLVLSLTENYEIDSLQAATDVKNFLSKLKELELINE